MFIGNIFKKKIILYKRFIKINIYSIKKQILIQLNKKNVYAITKSIVFKLELLICIKRLIRYINIGNIFKKFHKYLY